MNYKAAVALTLGTAVGCRCPTVLILVEDRDEGQNLCLVKDMAPTLSKDFNKES